MVRVSNDLGRGFTHTNSSKNLGGFTLIEVLLTVAIISVITLVTAPVYLGFQQTNELDVATNTFVQYLYQTQ